MPTSFGEIVQTAIAIGVGIVFGGTIVRVLVTKWLKDREDFEKGVQTEFRTFDTKLDALREMVDRGDKMVREEDREARDVLRQHIDHEDKILRDRWHQLDTLAQIIVNDVKLIRADLHGVMEGQAQLAKTIHQLDLTLARFAPK